MFGGVLLWSGLNNNPAYAESLTGSIFGILGADNATTPTSSQAATPPADTPNTTPNTPSNSGSQSSPTNTTNDDTSTTPPPAPSITLTTPANNYYGSPTNLQLSWSASNDSDNSVTFKVCLSRDSDMGKLFQPCQTTTNTSMALSNLLPKASDQTGHWYWQVSEQAPLLTQPVQSSIQSFYLGTPPTVALSVDNSGEPITVGHNAVVAIAAQATSDQLANCSVTVTDANQKVLQQYDCMKPLATNWDTTALASGDYTVAIQASDTTIAQNNLAPVTASIVVTVDNTPPPVTINNNNHVVIADGYIVPDITIDSTASPFTYAWVDDPANPAPLVYDHTQLEPTMTPTAAGTYTATLTVTDTYGNSTDVTFVFTYNGAPTISVPTIASPLTPPPAPTPPPAAVEPSATPTTADAPAPTPPQSSILGDSTIKQVTSAAKDPGAIVPTNQGWQLFGLLWYWWGLIIAAVIALGWLARRVVKTSPKW